MNFHILTLFPEMIEQGMHTSIIGRAIAGGYLSINAVNIRDYAFNKHQKVDDYPYGGGAGMLMQAEPVYLSYEAIKDTTYRLSSKSCLSDPSGKSLSSGDGERTCQRKGFGISCAAIMRVLMSVYLDEIVTDYVSIGDYVLTGGELPAMVMMDSISRMVPGVSEQSENPVRQSLLPGTFSNTRSTARPEDMAWAEAVPPVLLSGHHANIEAWRRREQSVMRTAKEPAGSS